MSVTPCRFAVCWFALSLLVMCFYFILYYFFWYFKASLSAVCLGVFQSTHCTVHLCCFFLCFEYLLNLTIIIKCFWYSSNHWHHFVIGWSLPLPQQLVSRWCTSVWRHWSTSSQARWTGDYFHNDCDTPSRNLHKKQLRKKLAQNRTQLYFGTSFSFQKLSNTAD